MMRPTPRAVLLFAAGIPLSLILVLINESLWTFGMVYFGGAVLLTGVDALLALPSRRLDIGIRVPEILFIGDRDHLLVTVSAVDWERETRLRLVCDVGTNLQTLPPQTITLAPGGIDRLVLPLMPERRGTVMIHRLWLRWHGPFALMWKQRIEPIAATIPVVPNIRALRTGAIRFFSRDAQFGIKAQKLQGDGSEFDALRDYARGLDHRSIDWKHSARHRKLVCKEFQAERNHQIILAFDTGHLMSEPVADIPKLDHGINAGLLLAYFSLRSGDRVGLFGFDARVRLYAKPVGGLYSFGRIQRASSELEYHNEETNFTLGLAELLTRFTRRSLVILFTDFVDTVTAELMVENVERLAARHLVVFVTLQDPSLLETMDAPLKTLGDAARATVADVFIRERTVVFERLRRLGVHCLDVPREKISGDLLSRFLFIKRRELI